MSTRTPDAIRRPAVESRPDGGTAEVVVDALTSAGLLDPTRRADAVSVVGPVLSRPESPGASLRHRLPEVAGYLGAAFVTAAVVLLVAREWNDLAVVARVGLLVAVSVALVVAAAALVRLGGGVEALRSDRQVVRRRLASTLATGGAVAGAGAVLVAVLELAEQPGDLRDGALVGVAAGATLLLLSLVGYRIAPSLVGQAAAAIGATYTTVFAAQAIDLQDPWWTGAALVPLGAVWLLLAERHWWREQLAARAFGLAVALLGAQTLLFDGDHDLLGYLLTGGIAVAGFGLYVALRAWPYLAAGVVALTALVPEVVLDLTDGSSLGTGLALLAAGATLLGSSLLGMRLRRPATGPDPEPVTDRA